MFKLLKEKLKSFFSSEEEKKAKKTKDKPVKKVKAAKEKKAKAPSERKLKKIADKIKEEVPVEFNAGTLKYEPNVRVIKERTKQVEESQEGIEKESAEVA